MRRAYFGYCGGALLAYLLARAEPPDHLLVGSFAAPDVALVPRRLHRLTHEDFWDVVLAQGGVPPELAGSELRDVFEDALRADFELYAGYFHIAAEPLDVPITVLAGRADTGLGLGALLGWRRQSTRPVELCRLDTGHWMVDEDPRLVADQITRCLAAAPGSPAGDGAAA